MRIEEFDYETLIASDVERDSLQFECYRKNGTVSELVFEVVRFDTQRKFSFIPHAPDIPLALLLELLPVAKERLGAFLDDSDF